MYILGKQNSLILLCKGNLYFHFSTDGCTIRIIVSGFIWKQMLSIFLCYFVTLSIYPGVLSDLISPRFGTWMPVLVMTVFNLFDLMGKVNHVKQSINVYIFLQIVLLSQLLIFRQ